MNIKSPAVTLLGSALVALSCLQIPAQAQTTVYTDGDHASGAAGSWTDDLNWSNSSPLTISAGGGTPQVQIGVVPSANSQGDIILDTSSQGVNNSLIGSLTFNSSLSTGITIVTDGVSTLQVNGPITNNSSSLQTLQVGTTTAGANATYAGGTGGLLIGGLDLKQRTITTTGTVQVNSDLYSTVSTAVVGGQTVITYGHIGAITSAPGLNFHVSNFGTNYNGNTGDFFQIATGTFTGASFTNDVTNLTPGLSFVTSLVQKGILFLEPTAGTTVINSGVVLPIDKDSEFNVAGTAIVFNGTTAAAELLTDNAEDGTNTPFSTTRNITINSTSNSIIAAKTLTTATYGGVISDAGGSPGTLTLGDATNHGTVVLTNNNSSFTGGTTVVAGVNLQIGNTVAATGTNSATGTGAVSLAAGNTLTGTAAGAKIGGQVNLMGNNTITTTAGSLSLGSLSVANTGNVISTNSAVTGNTTITGTGALAVNGALTGTLGVGTGTLTGAGSVSGAVTVAGGTINGSGLALTTGATFSGTTNNVLAGTETGPITVAAGGSLTQSTGGNSSGTLTLGTGTTSFTAAGTSTVGAVTLNGGGNTLTGTTQLTTTGVSVNSAGNTIAGTVLGAITQNIGSSLTVTGSAGSDALNTGSTLSGTGTVTTVTLAGTDTLTSTGTLHTSGVTVAGAGNAISTGSTVAGNTTITGTGALAVNGALTGTLGVGTGTLTGTGSVSGAVTAAGGTINGTGLHLTSGATYSGAGNTLAGTETGSITEAGGAALTQSTTGTLTGALALGFGTTSFTAAGTSTVGAVTLNGGGNTLTGTTNLTTSGITVSGLGNTIAGTVTGAITQTASSSLAVNGTAGTDSVGTNSTLSGTGTVGAVTLAGADTLTSSGTLHTGGITVNGSDTIGAGTITGNTTIVGTGSLDDEGALTGTLGVGTGTLTGAGSVSGAVTVAGGTINGSGLALTTGATFSGTTNNLLAGTETGPITVAAGGSLTQSTGGNSSGTLTLGTGTTSFTAAGTSTVGAVTLNGGGNTLTGTTQLTTTGVSVNGAGNTIAGTVLGAITQNIGSSLTVTGSAGSDALNTGSTLSGTGTVTTVTLAGTDTLTSTGTLHTSGVTVAGAGNAISTGSTVAGNTTITGTGALAVNGALTGTLGVGTGTLTGTGSVSGAVTAAGGTINGTGLHLTSGATYSGAGNTLAGTETGSITEAGGAALTQSTTGTLTGALALGFGTTSFTAAGTSTVGAVTLNGGGNTLTGTTNLTTSGITVSGLGNTIAGTVTGAITQTASSSLAVNGTAGTDSVGTNSTLSGTGTVGAVTLAGADTLTSSGTLHTGGITVNGSDTIGAGTITGNTTLGAGAALAVTGNLTGTIGVGNGTLTGTGTISGAATVGSGGKIDTSAGLGTLTIGGLTTSSGSALNFAISTTAGVTSTSEIASTGSLSIGSNTTVNLSQIAGTTLVDGFYTLLTYSGAAPTQGNLVLASTTVDGQTLSLDYVAGQVRLHVMAPVSTTTYTLGSSATATRVLTNGTTTVTSTITNTGSSDTLTFTNLNATASAGTITGGTLPVSTGAGAPLAHGGGTASGTGTFTAPGTVGAVTITPTVASAINTTAGTPSTLANTSTTTINVVTNRTVSGTPVALGRVMTGVSVSGTSTLTSPGSDATNTRVTVGTAGPDGNGVSATGGNPATVYNGSTSDTRTVGGTINTIGNITGSLTLPTTGEGLAGEAPINVTIGYTADAVQNRVVNASSVAFGRVMTGVAVSSTSNLTSAGSDATNTRVKVGTAAADSHGISATGGTPTTVFNGTTSDTRTVGGTFNTTGNVTGSLTLNTTGEGLAGEAPINVTLGYTADAVQNRVVNASSVSFGRVMTGVAVTSTSNLTSAGSDATNTRVTVGTAAADSHGISATGGNPATVYNGTTTDTRTVGGTFNTTGSVTGTLTLATTGEGLAGEAPINVSLGYTADAVQNRVVNASSVSFGRVLEGQAVSATSNLTSAGSDLTNTRVTVGTTGADVNGISATGGNTATVYNGTTSDTRTVGGAFITTGNVTGTLTLHTTGEGLTGEASINVNLGYTADSVAKRTITNGATTNLGVVHSGGAVSGTSSTFTTTGTTATTTSVKVAAGSGTADVNGVTATGAANTFDGSTSPQSGTRTLSGTVSSVGGGAVSGTINLGVTTLENGGAGLAGEGAYAPVALNYTAFVYTGQGVWKTNGSGTWGTVSATPANWTANGGTPGLDANFTTTDTATFGSVTTAGTAVVTLDGDNPSLKGITFNDPVGGNYNLSQGTGGTLHLKAATGLTATIDNAHGADQISAPVELDSNTSISVDSGGDVLTVSGVISGAATNSLTLNGPGKIILGGTNTFTGATTITSGTVQFTSANALTSSSTVTQTGGTIDVDGNAQMLQNFSSTGGTITNTGAGTTITFDTPADPVNASNITGNIIVNKTGAGLLALTGNNTYTGGTTINGGTLQAGSATAFGTGDITLNTGTLGTYTTNGTHIINVGHNYVQNGGTLFLNINGPQGTATNDIVNVTGTATINDGNLNLHFGFLPTQGESFVVLTSGGGVFGPAAAPGVLVSGFANPLVVNQPGIKLAGTVTGAGDDITLTVNQAQLQLAPVLGSYATPNRTAILTALSDPSLATNDPTLFNILAALVTGQSADALPASLADTADQFNPAKFGNFVQTTIVNTAVFNTAELDSYWESQRSAHGDFLTSNAKLNSSGLTVLNPSMDPALAQVGSRLLAWSPASLGHGLLSDSSSPVLGGVDMKAVQPNESLSSDPFSAFVVGNVILAQGFSQSDVAHSDTTTGGVQLGADYRLTPHLRAGALFSFNHTDGTLDTNLSKATIDSYAPGAYISYADGGWYANGVASYGFNNYTEDRHMSLLGASAVAHGAASGEQITANLDGGYDFHVNKFTFGPLAGLQYTHLSVDSYNEDGASNLGANLAVGDQSGDSLRSRVGGHVSYLFQTGRVLLTPHLDVSWQHEFMDQAEGITAGVGGVPFTVTTARPSRDSALIDGGVNADLNGTVSVFGDYLIQAGQSNYFGQSIQAGVKIGF